MLRPIPSVLLTQSITVKVCTGTDAWQNPTWKEYAVTRVHIQSVDEITKTTDNTEVRLTGVLYVDTARSTPVLDWEALYLASLSAGRAMRVNDGTREREVVSVDPVPDIPATRVHHVEVGLV